MASCLGWVLKPAFKGIRAHYLSRQGKGSKAKTWLFWGWFKIHFPIDEQMQTAPRCLPAFFFCSYLLSLPCFLLFPSSATHTGQRGYLRRGEALVLGPSELIPSPTSLEFQNWLHSGLRHDAETSLFLSSFSGNIWKLCWGDLSHGL